MSVPISNRYDFVYLFDVTDGNPNGDPDAGNMPRIDVETGQGLVSDVCLKRKIRNYVELLKNSEQGYRIWVKEGNVLNRLIEEAYEASNDVKKAMADWAAYEKEKKRKERNKDTPTAPGHHIEDVARKWMCDQFFDIRTFGAVMTTGKEKTEKAEDETESKIRKTAGQVRGPVQMGFSRSIDRIFAQEHALTVCAARMDDKPVEQQIGIQGRKFTVPYGLYRGFGYISPSLADPSRNGTGFSEDDLKILKTALNLMFEDDHSAARGQMKPVRCIAFRHENKLGNARADQLFARVKVELKPELKAENRPPRSKEDYSITVAAGDLPEGVTVEEWA